MLAYVSNGYTVEYIYIKEILIASVALLVVPKNLKIDIEEFTGISKLLPLGMEKALTSSRDTIEKLNNVSDTLNQMAKNYEVESSILDKESKLAKEEEKKNENLQIFIANLLDAIDEYKDNMLYDDLVKPNSKITAKLFNVLLEKQEIKREDLLKCFKECNSYIIGLDDKDVSNYLEENIIQIIKCVNIAYKISKSDFVWNKKLEENKKSLEIQIKGVSSAISSIADKIASDNKLDKKYQKESLEIIELLKQKDIIIQEISIKNDSRYLIDIYLEEYYDSDIISEILSKVLNEKIVLNKEITYGKRYSYLADDKYIMALADILEVKDKNDVSGDNILNIRLKDGKYLLAISDGMGSGKKANESSKETLKMLENLLLSGFDRKTSIDLITTSLINKNDEMFSTLDMAIVDLYNGKIEFIKSAACPTYIKNNKKVQIIKSKSLPLGIVNSDNNLEVFDKDIRQGDIMLMCTDGVLESNIEYKNKELWIKYLFEDIESTNTKKIADLVIGEAIDNNFGKAKDDMTILVCKFLEKDN